MRILIAVDGSDASYAAIEQVAKFPWQGTESMTILTIVPDDWKQRGSSELRSRLEEESRSRLAKIYLDARESLGALNVKDIKQRVETGHPSRCIVEAARSENADLIVLGARGHSTIYRTFLGSTADYVANHASCSVLIARKSQAAAPPYRVLLAYDGSEWSRLAMQQMAAFQWPADSCEIHVAMCLERPAMLPDDTIYDADSLNSSEQELSKSIDTFPGEVTYSVAEAVHPAERILAMASDRHANLIALGGTGKSALSRFFLGSVGRRVLHHAECSIWIARKSE